MESSGRFAAKGWSSYPDDACRNKTRELGLFKTEETKSKTNIVETLKKIENSDKFDVSSLLKSDDVTNYKDKLTTLFNEGESKENIESYKKSVLNILKLKKKVAN